MPSDWKKHNLQLKLFEEKIRPKKYKIVAGVDEAGRGPLAGPVVACSLVLRESNFTTKIFDSKRLTLGARQRAFAQIIKNADIGIGIVHRGIIDEKNILQATVAAINKALQNLPIKPEYLLIDGTFRKEDFVYPSQSVIKGDCRCLSVACASIVAKIFRDDLMSDYALLYPQYCFERNHGYFTKEHLRAIKKHGLSPIHRRSFRPICIL